MSIYAVYIPTPTEPPLRPTSFNPLKIMIVRERA
jgi:hypothetical protein